MGTVGYNDKPNIPGLAQDAYGWELARAARDHSTLKNGQVTLQVTIVIMGISIEVKGIYLSCRLLSHTHVAQDPTTLN
jgi:hypothetical protein